MRLPPLDSDALECVAAILEEGSFHRAARALSVTQSAVSQRLRALEEQIGTPLIVRTRPLKATAAGEVVLKHAGQARLLRANVERELRELAPGTQSADETQRISIAVGADCIATWAMPALDALVRRGLLLEVVSCDRNFTHELLREGQVAGCVTTEKQAPRGCTVLPLGTMRYLLVAEPGYADRYCPTGLTAHNFTKVTFVAANRGDDMPMDFVGQAFGLRQVGLRQSYLPGSEAQVRAILSGWGAGVVPELLAEAFLEQGRLVDLLPAFRLAIPLYWHCWQMESEVLAQLTSALREAALSRRPGSLPFPAGPPGRPALTPANAPAHSPATPSGDASPRHRSRWRATGGSAPAVRL